MFDIICRVARVACVLVIVNSLTVSAQNAHPLWGGLEPGRHRVGFDQLFLRDLSRPSLADGRPGREIRIVVWYPARSSGSPMTYGNYVSAVGQAVDFRPLDSARRQAALAQFVQRAADLGGDTAMLRRRLPAVMSTRVAAARAAAPAAGRFPLVLFPEWRPPASNSIMGEYLASHGFVVASLALTGFEDEDLEFFAPRGIETLVDDLGFALNALARVSYIDAQNTAAMGVGIAATGALAFQNRSPAVRAFISLEGGVTTAGERRLISRLPRFDIARANVPLLAITAPHPDVDVARLDVYRYAPQRRVHFAGMGEFWFLDYGMLEQLIPGVIGRPPGDVRRGFEWGARYVERFLSAQLLGDSAATRWLDSTVRVTSVFTAERRVAAPAPPSLSLLKRMLDSGGAQTLQRLVEQRIVRDSQPISLEHFVNLSNWIAPRDPRGVVRLELAQLRANLYPRSARALAGLGQQLLRGGDTTAARVHLRRATELIDQDDDPLLDHQSRMAIRAGLRSIGGAPPP